MTKVAHFVSNQKRRIFKIRYILLYLLISIVCLVIPAQLREKAKRRTLFSQSFQRVIISLPVISPNCRVETRYFYIQLPSCDQFSSQSALQVIGRVTDQTDDRLFAKKRLMVESITPLAIQPDSLNGWWWLWWHQVQRLKQQLFGLVLANTSPYQAALVLAVVFGQTDWLSPSIKPNFETTGTLHILAASGQNIALLTSLALATIPAQLPRWLLGVILLLLIPVYVLIVGLQPSIVRAAVMAIHLMLARYIWVRQSKPLYSLVISGLLLVIVFPEWLWAIGFQLSMMASFGIIILYPIIQRLNSRVLGLLFANRTSRYAIILKNIGQYWLSLFGAGIAAQLATFFILLKNFGMILALSFIPSAIVGSIVPLLLNLSVFGLFALSALKLVDHPTFVDYLIGLLAFWLPADLFLHLLSYCSSYNWGRVTW